MSQAFIQKPAPPFSGTAVNKHGEFIDLKLSDYKGMNLKCPVFSTSFDLADNVSFLCRQICDPVLLPVRFVSTIFLSSACCIAGKQCCTTGQICIDEVQVAYISDALFSRIQRCHRFTNCLFIHP